MDSRSPSPERKPVKQVIHHDDNPFALPELPGHPESRGRHQGRDIWAVSGLGLLPRPPQDPAIDISMPEGIPVRQRVRRASRSRVPQPSLKPRKDRPKTASAWDAQGEQKTRLPEAGYQPFADDCIISDKVLTQPPRMRRRRQVSGQEEGAAPQIPLQQLLVQRPSTAHPDKPSVRQRRLQTKPLSLSGQSEPPVPPGTSPEPMSFAPMLYEPHEPANTGSDREEIDPWMQKAAEAGDTPFGEAPVTVTSLSSAMSDMAIAPTSVQPSWFDNITDFLITGYYVPLNEEQRSQLPQQIEKYKVLIEEAEETMYEEFACSPYMSLSFGEAGLIIRLEEPSERLSACQATKALLEAFYEGVEDDANTWRLVVSQWAEHAHKVVGPNVAEIQVLNSMHDQLEPYVVIALQENSADLLWNLPARTQTVAWCYSQLKKYRQQVPKEQIGSPYCLLNLRINGQQLTFTNPGHNKNHRALDALLSVLEKLFKNKECSAEMTYFSNNYSVFFELDDSWAD